MSTKIQENGRVAGHGEEAGETKKKKKKKDSARPEGDRPNGVVRVEGLALLKADIICVDQDDRHSIPLSGLLSESQLGASTDGDPFSNGQVDARV